MEPCENCEVLREENRALQRDLETARNAYEVATAQLRAALEAAEQPAPTQPEGAE